MAYPQAAPKADNPSENKFFYWCQTIGCGAVINPEFPIAERNPSPKYCRDCQSAETRRAIQQEFDERNSKLLVKG
jgi:hypothetical protein